MSDYELLLLIKHLQSFTHSIIAFSGGVDSTFLVKAAQLAGIRFLAVTASSETTPRHDIETAKEIALMLKIPHRMVRTRELDDENFVKNPPDRCFYCKEGLFNCFEKIASKEGYKYILDGSNADDVKDYRPGLKANERHKVRSPLMEVGLGKQAIRKLSRSLGLPTWDLPSSPCLSSRFPYGEKITRSGLSMVAEAEDFIKSLGFKVVRVRTAGSAATIEVGTDELNRLYSEIVRKKIFDALTRIGYKSILFDPEGYAPGKLNRPVQH